MKNNKKIIFTKLFKKILPFNKKKLFIGFLFIAVFNLIFNYRPMSEQDFWKWYGENSDRLYNELASGKQVSLPEVGDKLRQVDKNLTFQFGLPDPKTKKAEFVISADGMRDGIPAVEKLVKSAPKYDKWNIIAFRQRTNDFYEIEFNGIKLSADDVYFKDTKEGEKTGMDFFIRDYDGADKRYIGATFILLDNTLGEYDVMTKLSFIEFHTLDEGNMKGLKPLKELPKLIDSKKK